MILDWECSKEGRRSKTKEYNGMEPSREQQKTKKLENNCGGRSKRR
jgi:hypothetical protein